MKDPISSFLGTWSSSINLWSILFRLLLSIIFSGLVGWERSSKRHAAGLRTFILVSMGATLAMTIDLIFNRKIVYWTLVNLYCNYNWNCYY